MLKPQTKQVQTDFADYCRTGIAIDLPGARHDRLPHYRRLVINVIKDTLSQAYPLTKNLLGAARFDQLAEEFFANHRCQHEQVFRMAGELVTYFAQQKNHPVRNEFPFIDDLLEFEWIELDVYIKADVTTPKIASTSNIKTEPLLLNPIYTLSQFKYPVFLKKANEITDADAGQYYCLAHRHPESFKAIFTELSAHMVLVVEQLAHGQTLQTIFNLFADAAAPLNEHQQNEIAAGVKGLMDSGFVLATC